MTTFSPTAIATFKEMMNLDARCRCRREDPHHICGACNKYWKAHSILEAELGVSDFPVVQKPGTGPHSKAQERYRMLCEAAA
jgi:hypothetical protein